ncbi:hypothetical protein CC1G_05613 [Coprinopsis cinerea okayama7|uniref:Uncharacterized protein n=1 Tax=Coprinopsis cinerea (strain Okayama-7 / 130 / ATCC MYA-4618 / FGSC 9003) TaxID=240176 RepID=A8P1M5_COPC7|nr:hypothetical protein CC1G_05613 [Coprinopsis cinerea okayama7\|eukprot:XP_001838132.1 hypothetical protein CC1G_05613 [Coprinopsis cinerea okayama7\
MLTPDFPTELRTSSYSPPESQLMTSSTTSATLVDASFYQPQSTTGVLSAEVLCHIFTFNAERSTCSLLATLATSHVCRWWRALAVSYPELWRPFALLGWVEGKDGQPGGYDAFSWEILSRCRGATIDAGWRRKESLELRTTPTKGSSAIHQWTKSKLNLLHSPNELEGELCNLNLMRSYFLPMFGGYNQWATVSTFFGIRSMAAQMEDLEVVAWADCQRGLWILPGDMFEQGPALADSDSEDEGKDREEEEDMVGEPRLQRLSLKHCWIDLSSPTIRLDGLRVLEITSTVYLDITPTKPGSRWSDYWAILVRCPALEELKLEFARLAEEDEESELRSSSPPKAQLPNLRSLQLKSRLKEVHLVFKTLSIPATCHRRIEIEDGLLGTCDFLDPSAQWGMLSNRLSPVFPHPAMGHRFTGARLFS